MTSKQKTLGISSTGWGELAELGSHALGGAIGAGIAAEVAGGDFWRGMEYGAIGGSIAYAAQYFVKWNNGPLKQSDHNIGHRAAQWLGRVWNLPNTAVGLLWAGTGKLLAWSTVKISVQHNAIVVENHPLVPAQEDVTLGNVVSYGGTSTERWDFYDSNGLMHLDDAWRHTLPHTYQGQQLGLPYLPSNLCGQIVSGFMTLTTNIPAETADRAYNWNEWGPYRFPRRNW